MNVKIKNSLLLCVFIGFCAIKSEQETLLEDTGIIAKLDRASKLVNDAVAQIKKQGIAVSCRAFMEDASWRDGEMYVWIFDAEGNCYCRGFEKTCLWKKFPEDPKDDYLKRMLEVGKSGGFIDYKWDNGYSRAYVKNIKVGNKTFIVGAGIFPTSSVYTVQELVSSALLYLKKTSFTELKERINNPTGIFVRGDIHLEVYAFDGTCVANGEQLALIGQNLLEATSGDGKLVVRDLIKIAKTTGEGWYEYRAQNGDEPIRLWVKKIIDPETSIPYALTCSYYTQINEDTVTTLVKKAANFLKANGREKAFARFNTQNADFVMGNVNIFVYNSKGIMVADSKNPAFVGLNLINTRDSQGRFITRQILDMANTYGKGWVTNALSNAYQVSYCEKVSISDGDFIIGAAYFPVQKENFIRFMIEDAVLYMQNHPLEESLRKFTTKDLDFLRGDMSIFVYNMDGICLADGLNLNKIWANDLTAKDDNGVRVIDKVIAVAKTGGGWLKFNLNNAVCNIYIKTVDKGDEKGKAENYIIGSGYYE